VKKERKMYKNERSSVSAIISPKKREKQRKSKKKGTRRENLCKN